MKINLETGHVEGLASLSLQAENQAEFHFLFDVIGKKAKDSGVDFYKFDNRYIGGDSYGIGFRIKYKEEKNEL